MPFPNIDLHHGRDPGDPTNNIRADRNRHTLSPSTPPPRYSGVDMAIPSHLTSHGTFFLTAPTHNRRRLFQVDRNAELFLETLQHYRREGHYKLWAFVVMPDHVHLLLTPQGITLERAMQLIKGGFSHRLASKLPVWQRGYTDRRVRDRADFDAHVRYIHDNPLRARLCKRPEDFPFSSASRQTDPSG